MDEGTSFTFLGFETKLDAGFTLRDLLDLKYAFRQRPGKLFMAAFSQCWDHLHRVTEIRKCCREATATEIETLHQEWDRYSRLFDSLTRVQSITKPAKPNNDQASMIEDGKKIIAARKPPGILPESPLKLCDQTPPLPPQPIPIEDS